ncbi:class I SAM-dependent methyltransferase [Phyllobacterium sp. P30BS-XVII]|uniref:class I SAM-dependent methyltransferase n=1 Tax=Phyllobacterium sp. P30BS-XVII TaxID=2587046 RepID=UPI0015F99ECE|nr:class I SAM-dependent methyltransferase [Phyllobacterium sp. P30BS-XVII]MBA8903670.1 SAM-dependent methyltransferase [Phyllobacterium sp. P30BS-XVII]
MNLYNYFINNNGSKIIKYAHYFPIYERYFSRYQNRPVTFLEIGTGYGGSAKMWKYYFGPMARIVSIDIRPECKNYEEEQIAVRIGSQSDRQFLQGLLNEFGPFDIVMDDGSHHHDDINVSFDFLYPRMARDGIYLAEDLNGGYWSKLGGGLRSENSFINRCKGFVDEMHARHTIYGENGDETVPETNITRTTSAIHFYDSIIVLEKTPYINKQMLQTPE